MDSAMIDMMMTMNPDMKEIPGIRQFFSQGLHWKMEKHDAKDNAVFFDKMNEKGWRPCMDAHRDACGDVFTWSCYDAWCYIQDMGNEELEPDENTYNFVDDTLSSDEDEEYESCMLKGEKVYKNLNTGKYYQIMPNMDLGDEIVNNHCCNPECDSSYGEYGNNPRPLWTEGRCCNDCNDLVIMERMGCMKIKDGCGKDMVIPKKALEQMSQRQGVSVEELIELMKNSDCSGY